MKIASPINQRFAAIGAPRFAIPNAATQRQVELFLRAALVLFVLTLLGGVSVLLDDGLTFGAALILAISAISLLAYLLGRTPRYPAAIALATVTLNLAPFVYLGLSHILPPAKIFEPSDVFGTLAWLGPGLLLSGILLPFRRLLALGSGTTLLAGAVPVAVTHGDLTAGIAAFGLTAAMVTLVAIARIQARRLERARTQELIAARDRLEERMSARTAHLERLNAELQDARQAIETAFQSRSGYLAEISHDMRAPLTVILGYTEMLAYRARQQADDELARQLHTLETSARYVVELSRNMIDLAALERGELEFHIQRVSLPELYDELCLLAQPLVVRNQNRFESHLAGGLNSIETDSLRLRQALLNLLDNAAKFTHNGRVRLEIAAHAAADGDEIAFIVTDTGIGIAPQQLRALFQPFPPSYRATQARSSGAGLGLAITHLICQRLGGRIEVSSQVGSGSCFTLYLAATSAAHA